MEFEAHEKEEEGDADLGEGELRLAAADEAEPVRSDQRAGDQIAEHGAEPEAAEDQHEQRRNPEQDRALEQRGVGRGLRSRCGSLGREEDRTHAAAACPLNAATAASKGSRMAPCRAG